MQFAAPTGTAKVNWKKRARIALPLGGVPGVLVGSRDRRRVSIGIHRISGLHDFTTVYFGGGPPFLDLIPSCYGLSLRAKEESSLGC